MPGEGRCCQRHACRHKGRQKSFSPPLQNNAAAPPDRKARRREAQSPWGALSLQAEFGAARVRSQAFAVGQNRAGDTAHVARPPQGLRIRLVRFWKSYTPAGRAGGAAGGQHVVGAGAVVAQAFEVKQPMKMAPACLSLGSPGGRLGDGQFQVFRGDVVAMARASSMSATWISAPRPDSDLRG